MSNDGELAIYEVYYYEDGRIQGYSSVPSFPHGETLDELRENTTLYLKALEKEIIKYQP